MTEPILLKKREARAYLAGADPGDLARPLLIGNEKFWARAALDRAVAERAGLAAAESGPAGASPDELHAAWKKTRAADADGD